MAKTYQLKALWPLLAFETAPAPLLATLDAYGDELVKYAVTQVGFWLFSRSQPFDANESEGLTGFHPADLAPKQIDGVEGYVYGLQSGTPLLPLPFTAAQLIEFDKRTAGLVAGNIERGSETDGWITDLAKENPDAAELARGIHAGKWPVATAKPRFHLAGGIVPDASAKAVKSALDQIQQQQDAMRLTGISPLLLNDINRVKEYQKLISPTSIADTAYLQAMQPSEALLRAAIPTNNQAVADLLSQQKISLSVVDDVMANAYLQTQRAAQLDIDKLTGQCLGSVVDAMHLQEQVGLTAAMGKQYNPSASDMVSQMERAGIKKAMTDAKRHETEIEFTPPPVYNFRADEERRRAREREHTIETARLAEIAKLEARDEYEANKKAVPLSVAPLGQETQEARQKRRYDLCIEAGLKMPNEDYSHLPTGVGALARAENISTAAFSKDVKAYIASRR